MLFILVELVVNWADKPGSVIDCHLTFMSNVADYDSSDNGRSNEWPRHTLTCNVEVTFRWHGKELFRLPVMSTFGDSKSALMLSRNGVCRCFMLHDWKDIA